MSRSRNDKVAVTVVNPYDSTCEVSKGTLLCELEPLLSGEVALVNLPVESDSLSPLNVFSQNEHDRKSKPGPPDGATKGCGRSAKESDPTHLTRSVGLP
jgi:hypothetical protein